MFTVIICCELASYNLSLAQMLTIWDFFQKSTFFVEVSIGSSPGNRAGRVSRSLISARQKREKTINPKLFRPEFFFHSDPKLHQKYFNFVKNHLDRESGAQWWRPHEILQKSLGQFWKFHLHVEDGHIVRRLGFGSKQASVFEIISLHATECAYLSLFYHRPGYVLIALTLNNFRMASSQFLPTTLY